MHTIFWHSKIDLAFFYLDSSKTCDEGSYHTARFQILECFFEFDAFKFSPSIRSTPVISKSYATESLYYGL